MPKPRKQTPRITKAEKEARVNKVYELLIGGARRYQICQYASSEQENKKDWNVTPRQVDRYIQEANALIAQEAEFHRPRELGRAIAALDDLYRRCMKVQDYGKALAARRELNALLSLYEPPAAQTVRIEGIDDAQLNVLVDLIEAQGRRPSDVFAALLQVYIEDADRT